MKKTLILLLTSWALLLPAAAQARPGQLDKTFGMNGRVITHVGGPSSSSKALFAWAGRGRIVAVLGTHLLKYLPDGRLDRSFGDEGRMAIAAGGESSFASNGIAVDSRGRILVSGTASRGRGKSGAAESSAVEVRRFFPNGRLDTSFGNNGSVLDDFGFPHPSREGQPDGSGPYVDSSGLTVDSGDRPVLTGSWLSAFPCSSLYCTPIHVPFVARLGEDGSLDRDFGSDGVFVPPSRESATTPTQVGGTTLFVAVNTGCTDRCGGVHPVLGRLDENGNLDSEFGMAGLADLPFFWQPPSVAVDRFRRILLAGAGEGESLLYLQRLDARGLPDTDFGDDGSRLINLPTGGRQAPGTLAVDHRSRPLLAISGRWKRQNYAILLRRNQRGGRDRSFGNNGQVWTAMPEPISPTRVLIGGNGMIVVGGALGKNSIALARYHGD
jgi:uncharacterized delta-60 repeat protein